MDIGVNNDRYKTWRQASECEIGYVHLAFKMLTQAIYEFFYGSHEEMVSAALFLLGDKTQSTYSLWCQVLGEEPSVIIDHVKNYIETGEVPPDHFFNELDRLYNNL